MQVHRHCRIPHTQAPASLGPAAACTTVPAAACARGQQRACSSSSHVEPQRVQQQVLGSTGTWVYAPVCTVQHQGGRHPAAVVAGEGVSARLTAHRKVLQVQHQHLLLLLTLRVMRLLLCALLHVLTVLLQRQP